MQPAARDYGRVVALDLGEVRTGVAISDAGGVIARPLQVVPAGELDGYLHRLVTEESVAEVLVGVPKTLSGEAGFQARRVKEKINALKDEFSPVKFVEWDERFTTRLAEAGAGGRAKSGRRGKREPVDHLAAAGMLQEYLEMRGRA